MFVKNNWKAGIGFPINIFQEDMIVRNKVYSICGMCTVRCPIEAEVENGVCSFIRGNPHAAGIDGAICARGAAGLVLINDNERPQAPMIRTGERGEGKWKQVSWEEALDYVAERLKKVTEDYGSRSILFSDRGGPFRDLHQAFVRGLGSPNYSNHDASVRATFSMRPCLCLVLGARMCPTT